MPINVMLNAIHFVKSIPLTDKPVDAAELEELRFQTRSFLMGLLSFVSGYEMSPF
jgi:hypothetical protein